MFVYIYEWNLHSLNSYVCSIVTEGIPCNTSNPVLDVNGAGLTNPVVFVGITDIGSGSNGLFLGWAVIMLLSRNTKEILKKKN